MLSVTLNVAITYVQHRPLADRCLVKKLLQGTRFFDTDGHLYSGIPHYQPHYLKHSFRCLQFNHAERGTREMCRGIKAPCSTDLSVHAVSYRAES